jgi:hypothetical protein
MRFARLLPLALGAIVCTGCLSSSAIIHVRSDGSGTITNSVLLKPDTMALLKSFQPSREGAGSGGNLPDDMFSEEKMRAMAPRMGEGVSFQSIEPVKQPAWEGAKVTFAFTDISQVRFDMRSEMSEEVGGKRPEVLTFRFARAGAGPARLTILMPQTDWKAGAASADKKPLVSAEESAMAKAMMAQFKQMFEGMRASVAVEVDGPIVKTNADYVNGSTVTLLSIDFSELMKNDGDFDSFAGLTDGTMSLAEAREKLKNVKGLMLTIQPEVSVEFR